MGFCGSGKALEDGWLIKPWAGVLGLLLRESPDTKLAVRMPPQPHKMVSKAEGVCFGSQEPEQQDHLCHRFTVWPEGSSVFDLSFLTGPGKDGLTDLELLSHTS